MKSRWRVVTWGLGIGAISLTLMTQTAPAAILTGISLGAVTVGSVQALTIALTGDLVSETQRGRAIGLLHTVGDLGSAIGPPAAYALLPEIGLNGVYLLCAGLFAIGLMLVLMARYEKPCTQHTGGDK